MTAIVIPNTFIPSTTISSTEMNANFQAVADAITASLAKDGSDAMTGQLKASNGTAALPSLTFGADPNTGIYRRGADDIGWSTNGAIRGHIDSIGRLIISDADVAAILGSSSITPKLQVVGVANASSTLGMFRFSADGGGPVELFMKSRDAAVGGHAIVQSSDTLGTLFFSGSDGTNFINAASILAAVDGTPGASNDMPGRLVFSTTPNGSGTLSECMRIDNAGRVIVGGTASIQGINSSSSGLQVAGSGDAAAFSRFSADSTSPAMQFLKSRNATLGSHTIVQSGDGIGRLSFGGSDGTNFIEGAAIQAAVSGSPGANDMPGSLILLTTPDGAAAAVERMRIDNVGFPIFTNAATTPPTLAVNSQFTFTLTSNTNLRISARGTDGTTRVGNITLA